MGILENNLMMDTVRGKVGKQVVFRKYRGATVVAGRPRPREKAFTEKQIQVQRRFSAAAGYAVNALADAQLKALYEQKAAGTTSTARSVAMTDYLMPPIVESIDFSGYTGAINTVLTITAIDDFKVTAVKVEILSATNQPLEAGEALQDSHDKTKWLYTTTVANASPAGTQVRATAFDTPGNKTSLTKVV